MYQAVTAPQPEAVARTAQADSWSLATRVGFRFSFVFFLPTLLGIPDTLPGGPVSGMWNKTYDQVIGEPLIWLVGNWIGPHVLHIEPVFKGPSSPGWYMLWSLILLIAAVATFVWSVLDRRRTEYGELHAWLCMFLRIFLGSVLLGFGMQKIFLEQMQLSPSRLMQSFGSASPMGMLWTFMASSPVYQFFTGVIETIAAIALFLPGLATLGACLGVIAMTTVLVLDIGYNVQVKTNAAFDLLVALFLLLPNIKALAGFLLLNRPAMPWTPVKLSRRNAVVVTCIAAQLAWGAYVFAEDLRFSSGLHREDAHLSETTPFYGIWAVQSFSMDGISRPLSLEDNVRWTRFAFDRRDAAGIQWSDGSVIHVKMKLDTGDKTIALSQNLDDPAWNARLTYEDAAPEALVLKGTVKGHEILATLHRSNIQFRLISEGIRWVQYGRDNR